MENSQPIKKSSSKGLKSWLKRIGLLGFLFFLIKGLVWLAVFYYGFQISGCES